MIQDIFPHALHNQYDPQAVPESTDYVLCFDGSRLAMKDMDMPEFYRVADLGSSDLTYLFSLDDTKFFLTGTPIPGCRWVELFTLRRTAALPRHLIFAAFTGKHLADWYRDTRFCGRCGQPMTHSPRERAMKCSCGYTAYPRIMPAVIVGVRNGDSLLLTQYRTGLAHNALIAGFTEIGETLEETVAREVMEEAGVKVTNIHYYKSQPWAVANDILMGYFCDVDGSTEIHMDSQELKVAHWVAREDIELQPDDFSLTNEMMRLFKEGKA